MNENQTRKCPRCGGEIPATSAGGLCPRCAAQFLNATATEASAAGKDKHAFIPPDPAGLAGKFPQLEILCLIGQGGMGAVYKARQRELDRVVALKILPPDIGKDPAFAERFAREAKAMARLNHPGIVTIHDFGRADGLFYFLMEFVDGASLGQLLRTGRVSPREALAIVPQICDALQYAHDQGLVHRDIKPENILLDRAGRVKVADFGLVKLVEGSEPATGEAIAAPGLAHLTEAGKVMGTPRYMAPEQVEHPAHVDHRADIYALGVVFYQMLTGELPGTPLAPPSRKVHIDVRLDEVVLRALENEPERRYQQASQVKTSIEAVTQAANPSSAQGGPVRGRRRSPLLTSLVDAVAAHPRRVMAVALAGVGALLALHFWVSPAGKARPQTLMPMLSNSEALRGIPSERSTFEFGPVIERTLKIDGDDCDFLSFTTGEVLHHAYRDGDADDSTPPTVFMQWVLTNGVDLGFCANRIRPPTALMALGMGTYLFPYDTVPQDRIPRFRSVAELVAYNEKHKTPAKNALIGSLVGVTNVWDDLTAYQLLEPTNDAPAFFLKEKQFCLWLAQTNLLHHPVAFCTRDGTAGLMLISSFAANPPSVKLRYKLVLQSRSKEVTGESRPIPDWTSQKPLSGWIADLQNPDPGVRKLAEQAISKMGTNALPEFLTILGNREQSTEADDRRYNAAAALKFIGPPLKSAIPAFVSLLYSGNQETAYAGARALAFTTPIAPAGFVELTNALVDPSPGVRDAATHGVSLIFRSESKLLAESALPLLLYNLHDPAQFVRADTAAALMMYVQEEQIHDRDAKPELIIPPIVALLDDHYSFSREYAGLTIKEYGQQAVPVLRGLLSDPDIQVRECATKGLKMVEAKPSTATRPAQDRRPPSGQKTAQ